MTDPAPVSACVPGTGPAHERDHPGYWPRFWNERFAGEGYRFGTEPNWYLRSSLWRASPSGEALALGDGEGRNGVFLAEAGYRVTTVDLSERGIAKARALADRRGVELHAIEADLADWTPPPRRFSVVALIYLHLPEPVRSRVLRAAASALAPGGLLVFEAFHVSQPGQPSGGPRDPTVLYDAASLRNSLGASLGPSVQPGAGDLRLLELLEGEIWLDEGDGHRGPARVVRALAQAGA